VAVCCGLPLLLAAGSAVTVVGLGLGSWFLIVSGSAIAATGLLTRRSRRRAGTPPDPG
jgi:hypothetical protein